MIQTLILLSPIALLIWLMTKKKSWPSYKAIPLVAILLFLLRFFVFKEDQDLLWASSIQGTLTAWVPILVVWGALFLFQSIEHSGAMKVIKTWLEELTHNKIAQIMLIGWAFAFFIEGASGFGTPVALAAPILVRLGFKPLKVVMLCLVMNSIPVSFGAVGLPTWFGLGQALNLSPDVLQSITQKTALMHLGASLVIPVMALRFLVPWKEIKKSWQFILLSILGCTLPAFLLAHISAEFSSLIGGMIGMIITAVAAHKQWGLHESHPEKNISISPQKLIKATFPLWGIALVLVLTRLDFLPFKALLTDTTPIWSINLDSMGTWLVSIAGVFGWNNILSTGLDWSHALWYVPSFVPFAMIGLMTLFVYGKKKQEYKKTFNSSVSHIVKPIISLTFALIFAKLLMNGDSAPSVIIGDTLANITGQTWPLVSPFVGALGSFFSGSNTVSNLTFGGMQMAIANNLNLDVATILALQNVGGAMGNMICIANIIAGCSVLEITGQEGTILKQTIKPLAMYGVIAGTVGLVLLSA